MTTHCAACGRENNPTAKYCRFCGRLMPEPAAGTAGAAPAPAASSPASAPKPAASLIIPADYVGHEKIRAELERIKKSIKFQRERRKAGAGGPVGSRVFVFRGETGAGKTLVASCFVNELRREHCLASDRVTVIEARKLSRQYADEFALAKFLEESKPAALLVDDITENTGFIHELILAVSKAKEECFCVVAGSAEGFEEFFKSNLEDKQRVAAFFDFAPLSIEELALILMKQLREKNYLFDSALQKHFEAYIRERTNDPSCEYRNGWLIDKDVIPTIDKNQEARLTALDPASLKPEDYRTIVADDLPLKYKSRTVDEILAELDAMVGMTSVKQAVRSIANKIVVQKKIAEQEGKDLKGEGNNIVLTGNPGTGKTTIVRTLGALFKAIGLLPSDKVIETDGNGLKGSYVGQSKDRVNEFCEKAMGGILFVDEAYTLANESGPVDQFAGEAAETLMKHLEDDRTKFVGVVAGYQKQMELFLDKINPGMRRRFKHYLHLPDYTPEELIEIFERFNVAKEGYTLTPEARELAREAIRDMYRNKKEGFGNAGEIRVFFEKITSRQTTRIAGLGEAEQTREALKTIEAADIGYEKKKTLSVDDVLAELDAMVGMADVKKAVREIANKLVIQQEIAEKEGTKAKGEGNNIVLTGNPGTGKTTIVRTLGKLFKAIGLLPTDNVIETDGNGLKGSYVGQSKDQVNEYCRKAMGGILFVDEAYTLANEQGPVDQFAGEAAETLMKHLEDDRTKFVGVVAGYQKQMELFLDKINPGMRRRFKHYLHLPDYSAEELFLILQNMAKQQDYAFTAGALEKAKAAVFDMHRNKTAGFGNAGQIRVFLEKITSNQSSRLSSLSKEERAGILKTIEAEDVPEPATNSTEGGAV